MNTPGRKCWILYPNQSSSNHIDGVLLQSLKVGDGNLGGDTAQSGVTQLLCTIEYGELLGVYTGERVTTANGVRIDQEAYTLKPVLRNRRAQHTRAVAQCVYGTRTDWAIRDRRCFGPPPSTPMAPVMGHSPKKHSKGSYRMGVQDDPDLAHGARDGHDSVTALWNLEGTYYYV